MAKYVVPLAWNILPVLTERSKRAVPTTLPTDAANEGSYAIWYSPEWEARMLFRGPAFANSSTLTNDLILLQSRPLNLQDLEGCEKYI